MLFRPKNCEIDFYLRSLSFDDQERVVTLLEEMQVSQAKSDQFRIVRQMIPICVENWSLRCEVETWGSKIDLSQAIEIVNACLKQNAVSEDDRKK